MESQNKLTGFYESKRKRILDTCTACGKCFDICPTIPYLNPRTADGSTVVINVLAVISRKADSADNAADAFGLAMDWMKGCCGSELCLNVCPEAVNPKMMLRIGKITALGGLGDPKLISTSEDPNWFPRIHAFARSQLTDQQQKEWM